ncbi:Pirin-related protein [Cylindrospermum stagnale PCC 7417]|uniref:Pirin-related protein n=1 Tax=Cylindrospermum stagnale PCC 7417 TaxID=56107 RepID=K9X650_9NOST|nr:pirin family protein [Cylindrospermum stagnale]AFZ27554.1 Pirin-related protein [Cylindrospermum stagnale PCC 7417]
MSQQTTKTHLIHDRNNRGHAQIDWLDSYHTFSFSSFYDPNRMGFRSLRVINDDRIAPGAGFPTHGHRDMEILTYVLSGAVEHKDSLGTGSVIRPGDAQIMSAGTGIQHSEFNPSPTEPLHLLQIWILPDKQGITPRYEQKAFTPEEKRGKLRLIAAKDGRDGAVTIHQDVDLYASLLESGDVVNYHVPPHRYAWLQIAQGTANLNGEELRAGDGVQINGEEKLEISTNTSAEILLFDLG